MNAEEPYVLHIDDRASIEHEIRHYDDPRAASIGALKIVQKGLALDAKLVSVRVSRWQPW